MLAEMETSLFMLLLPLTIALARVVVSLGNGNLLSFTQQIAWIGDQAFSAMQSVRNLNLRAQVLANVHGNEMDVVVGRYRDHVRAVLVDHQRGGRNDERWLALSDDELHFAVHAGYQRSLAVVHLNFCKHGSRREVHGLCASCHGCGVLSARHLTYGEYRGVAVFDGKGGRLRNLDLDP